MINIIYYFVFLSFLGWLIESIYVSIYDKKFVNRGMLFGPFIPIYGIIATILILLDNVLNINIIGWFFISAIIATIAEYVVSYTAEKLFKVHLWNYSYAKFNLNGRVCLKNAILFGVLGSVLIYFVDQINTIFLVVPPIIWIILFIFIILDYLANLRIVFITKKEFIKELGNRNFEFRLHLYHSPVNIRTLLIKRSELSKKIIREKLKEEVRKLKLLDKKQ